MPVRRLEWANALRGVAALSVLVFHYCVAFWVNPEAAALGRRPAFQPRATAPRFAKLLQQIPIDFGALGVSLFFLISGYVIAISLDRYSRRGFLVGRCMRVLPTYAVGYLVSCTVIWAAGNPNHELGPGHVMAGAIPGLNFLLGLDVPGDGIVWTLIIELVFYAVCLIGYRALTRRWQAIAAVALGCVLVQWLVDPPTLLAGSTVGGLRYLVLLAAPFLPVMLIGVTLSGRSRGQISAAVSAALVPALAGTHLWLIATTDILPTSLIYKLTFLGVISVFTAIWAVGHRWPKHPVADFFADISYPLYVVHPVLGYALLSVLNANGFGAPLAILLTAVTAIAAAWLLHRFVETPTHRLGQRWARSFAYEPAVSRS